MRTLVVRYASFAALTIFVNLAVQRLVLATVQGGAAFVAAVIAGTAVGLALKYELDRRWIFLDRSSGALVHGRRFFLYASMGVASTVIFWASETLCWLIWKTEFMRELGAVLGLVVGYVIKYRLDARFVFRGKQALGGA